MIDISINTRYDLLELDKFSRHILGNKTTGVSVAPSKSTIHLTDDYVQSDIDKANLILNQWDSLSVSADKNSILNDEIDKATITISDPKIASDANIGYTVFNNNGILFAVDTVAVTSGTATLEFLCPYEGVYSIRIFRIGGDLSSGSTTITVTSS